MRLALISDALLFGDTELGNIDSIVSCARSSAFGIEREPVALKMYPFSFTRSVAGDPALTDLIPCPSSSSARGS